MKKTFLRSALAAVCFTLLFTGCPNPEQLDPNSKPAAVDEEQEEEVDEVITDPTDYGKGTNSKEDFPEPEYDNPTYSKVKSESLDFIFNNQTLGTTTIVINRTEWKKLCDDYRYFYKNENCVHAEAYTYEKDGKSWTLKNVGFRLRGNTSRYCPQGIDNGNKQGQANYDWNPSYYAYANKKNKDYRQTHFKVDFEEFLGVDENGKELEQRMSDCMKGVALKRMDESCTREIFCYDLFRKNGIWTAPRASHTRLILKIREDDTDNSTTTVDFGVYEMFEEVNKQSLKARESGKNNKAETAWADNKGNLWKCANDLTTGRMNETGVEDIRIIYKDDEEKPAGIQTNGREDENRIGYIRKQYSLDLKTNKDNFSEAETELQSFITALNALPNSKNPTDSEIEKIKDFYEKWFDMDFFLKTYAVNILCGMDDDYWGNANNFYLYFGNDKNGNRKVWLIPFDYDNTLGHSISGDKEGFLHNPLDWGRGKDRPLMDRLLLVPEYKTKFTEALLEVCQNDYWKYETCSQIFLNWKEMVSPYIRSNDLSYTGLGVSQFADWTTWNPEGYTLTGKYNNIFDATREAFIYNLTGETVDSNHPVISQVNDSTDGFKIKIKNIPLEAAAREIFIDGKHVSSIERDWSSERNAYNHISKYIFDEEWQYPYTQDGKKYEVYVKYIDENYQTLVTSNKLTVTAHGGKGDLSANKDSIKYSIKSNKLVFDPAPIMKLGNNYLPVGTGYYKLETDTLDWNFLENKNLGQTVSQVDLNEYFPHNKGITKDTLFQFRLYYEIPNGRGDNYRYVILDFDDTKYSELHLTSDFTSDLTVDTSATKKGLNLKIAAAKIPSNAYNLSFFINGKKVSDMGRIYNNGEFPAEHIKDTTWNYPYVKAGNKYTVHAEYYDRNWNCTVIQGSEFVAKSGVGELAVNKFSYSVKNNKLVFSKAPSVTLNGQKLDKGNFRIEFRKVISEGDNWIGDTTFPYETTELALNNIFRGKGVDASTQFKVYLFYEIPNEEAGFKYRCEVINEEESINQNLHLNYDIPEMLTWDSSAATEGLNLKITASEIPEDAYSRELWVNGKYVLEMERDYSNGVHPAEYIKDTTINYPYVKAGREYKVYVKYHTKDWREYRSPEIKVKPTSGLGEMSLANKDSLVYTIGSNHLKFVRVPELKIGNETKEKPFYKFNFNNLSCTKDDKWIAGPEEEGPAINIDLDKYIDDSHRPVYKSDKISFELFYKEYVRDENNHYKYHYRFQILDHDDTKNANLQLTSDLLKRQE